MKKIIAHLRGYVSLFALFLIVVIVVITGFYGWQKYQEIKYPEKAARGEIKDMSYYFNAIKSKINQILERKDIRNERSLEMVEDTKMVTDKANLVSLEIPKSWTILEAKNAPGQISSLEAQSGYFKSHEVQEGINKKTFYDAGAKLIVSITKGENKALFSGNGGHTNLNSKRQDIIAGGQESAVHVFRDPNLSDGEFADAHVIYKGNTYNFLLAYNPANFTDAQYFFQVMLESVKFLK